MNLARHGLCTTSLCCHLCKLAWIVRFFDCALRSSAQHFGHVPSGPQLHNHDDPHGTIMMVLMVACCAAQGLWAQLSALVHAPPVLGMPLVPLLLVAIVVLQCAILVKQH